MLNNFKNIGSLFCEVTEFKITETFRELKLECYTSELKVPNQKEYEVVCQSIDVDDKVEVQISIDDHEPVSTYINESDEIAGFLLDVETVGEQKIQNSTFKIEIVVYKGAANSIINVYSYIDFLTFLKSKSLSVLLHSFNELICTQKVETFFFFDKEIEIITDTFICVGNHDLAKGSLRKDYSRENLLRKRAEVCSFNVSTRPTTSFQGIEYRVAYK